MPIGFSFGPALGPVDIAVAIPKLNEFLKDLEQVLRGYGVWFRLDCYDDYPRIILKPYDDAVDDLMFFVENLDLSDDGIPWLDVARAEYERQAHERLTGQKAAREKWLKDPANAPTLLREGIWLEGRHYKLVPQDE